MSVTRPYPAQFVARRKGQLHPKNVLPVFAATPPVGYSVQVVGSFSGFGGFGQPCTFQALVVTTPAGLQVPAYRIASPCNGYAVCQNLSYYPVQG